MATRLARIAIASLLAVLVAAAAAHADGDPASDVLLGQSVFYPYQPSVPAAVQRTLNSETAIAKRAGYPIRIALIGGPLDLGVIPQLFDHPQQYADFLYREISFIAQGPLLVVMPDGYGIQDIGGSAKLAASRLPPPAGKTPTALAQAAIAAVPKLATAAGHPIKGAPGVRDASAGAGTGSSTTPILIGLVAAAVLVAGGVLVLRRRQAVRPAR